MGGGIVLPFFTDPYPNELLYSAISRYHFYNGNVSFVDTLEELFGSRTVVPIIEFGSHLSNFVQNLGSGYSVEKILSKNTIYPFFAPFITKAKQRKVSEDVENDARGLRGRLGTLPTKIDSKKEIFFCKECVSEDIARYGEPYIHREHHLPAIYYCPHHEQRLIKYPVDYKNHSRYGYIRLDKRVLDTLKFQDTVDEIKEHREVEIKLSQMAFKLLNTSIQNISFEVTFNKYRALLRENNWIMKNSAVKQAELLKAFNAKFPKGFLERFNSHLRGMGTNNWLQSTVTNYKRQGIHPFRHLLLLYFFNQDIDSFLKVKEDEGPFGKGPWPCLNIAASHYKELVIPKVSITKREKTDVIIGKFKCCCGFEYTRTGPEKAESEKWIRSRITAYGDVWESKFNELVNLNMRPEDIALALGISESTVRNKLSVNNKSPERTEAYRAKLSEWLDKNPTGSRKQFQTEFKKLFTYLYKNDTDWLDRNLPSKRDDLSRNIEERLAQYRTQILKEIESRPTITRTDLWKQFHRACKWLHENDLEWFETNMPSPVQNNKNVPAVDWEARDEEYYNRIQQIYPKLLKLEKPVRITKKLFSKHLEIEALSNNRHTAKLPKTTALLSEITESVQDFRIRRCCLIIDKMLEKNGIVYFEKVREVCAIESKNFKKIRYYLEEYISKK